MEIPFLKMHGLGNDFVIMDALRDPLSLSPKQIQQIADRRRGIGCDQVLLMEPGKDVFMRIYNADGSEAETCGNGTRCIAWWVAQRLAEDNVVVQTRAGDLRCHVFDNDSVQVEMGSPQILSEPGVEPVHINFGNPHKLFFVPDCDQVNWPELVQQHGDDCNLGAVQVDFRHKIRLRVHERGTGLTQACGSGACAAFAAAHSRNLVKSECWVEQPGGELRVEMDEKGQVRMTGPVSWSFTGKLDLEDLSE